MCIFYWRVVLIFLILLYTVHSFVFFCIDIESPHKRGQSTITQKCFVDPSSVGRYEGTRCGFSLFRTKQRIVQHSKPSMAGIATQTHYTSSIIHSLEPVVPHFHFPSLFPPSLSVIKPSKIN